MDRCIPSDGLEGLKMIDISSYLMFLRYELAYDLIRLVPVQDLTNYTIFFFYFFTLTKAPIPPVAYP